MLEFEHLVQINDPDDASIKPLSRSELWDGLLLRARNPGRFNSALSCRVEHETSEGFVRFVQTGDVEFREEVTLSPQLKIETVTAGGEHPLFAQSITSIEEPRAGYLFVRFKYRRDLEDTGEGKMIGEHLKSAYFHTDIEAIALIRLLVEDQLLEQRPN